MSRRFRAYRKDASHAGVVATFKAQGCSVLTIHESAVGAPDLVVGLLGVDRMVEVKPTKEQAKAGEHIKRDTAPRPSQVKFHSAWRGARINVVHSPEEALALVASWRAEASLRIDAAVALKEKLAAGPVSYRLMLANARRSPEEADIREKTASPKEDS